LTHARDAAGWDTKTTAVLRFARQLVLERGRVSERAVSAVREAGATDAEILEIVTTVVLNVLTNYINLVADTEIDFPVVRTTAR
jgi:alkylhydroperoxidase family enzyme